MDNPKPIPKEVINFAYARHFALEKLKKYIEKWEEEHEEVCEYSGSWMKEFYECKDENEVNNFIKDFTKYD